MNNIRERFLQAEQDFIIAARSNDILLVDFAERWQALQSEWDSYLHEADQGTLQLVDGVTERVERLAGDLYAVRSHHMSLEEDLLNSLEDVFASLTLEDAVDCVGPVSTEVSPPVGSRSGVTPAAWLLQNLHNPYPLPHIRFSPCSAVGSKHIKDWFSKARQRIGWTRLLRDRFAGCRSLAVDAAFRAFVRDDPNNPLDADLKTAFLAIKSHAQLVYGGEDAVSPSPDRPRSVSPSPSLTHSLSSADTDDEPCPVLPAVANPIRPSKRPSSNTFGSPSPKRRRPCGPTSFPTPRAKDPCSLSAKTSPLCTKKRRLSESDSDSPRPKRPRGMEGDRLHAVSGSFCEATVPEWFHFDQTFQLPQSASIQPLKSSSFDLDFCDLQSLPNYTPPSPAFSCNNPALADEFSALFEIPQADSLQAALPFGPDWTEFLNFGPDLSLFPPSPSLISSSASTPPLNDDAVLSPLCGNAPGQVPVPDVLPPLSGQKVQFPVLWGPIIQEPDFLLPPGENAGISATSLLSIR